MCLCAVILSLTSASHIIETDHNKEGGGTFFFFSSLSFYGLYVFSFLGYLLKRWGKEGTSERGRINNKQTCL